MTPEDRHCSGARSLDVVGDRWSPLVIRDVALGVSRFTVYNYLNRERP